MILWDRLGRRGEGFRYMEAFLAKQFCPLIIETGCVRELNNWEGDGQSTIVLADFAQRFKGRLYSVDNDPEAVQTVNAVMTGNVTSVACEDSIQWLTVSSIALGAQKVDLLYLDSLDVYPENPHPAALHALMELTAIAPSLRHGSMVFVDDNFIQPDASFIGKGQYIGEFMKRSGREQVYTGYQMGWRW
jgi:hypothetical protein